jgi:hypothetical protein
LTTPGKVATAFWKQHLPGVVQFELPLFRFTLSVRSSFQYSGSTLKEYFDAPIALLKHCFILTSGHFHFIQLLMIPVPTSNFGFRTETYRSKLHFIALTL